MKIITLHRQADIQQLYQLLIEKLNPLFQEQKQSDISFTITDTGDAIEISQPDLYEGFLFRIAVNGKELWITRSEHYVDDVNTLTLESILNSLFEEQASDLGTDLVQEG